MPNTPKKSGPPQRRQLPKRPTGIKGFDEITEGGLPRNRISLFSGSTGTGKTLLGLDFLIKGALHYKERGIFMSFEETEEELLKDVVSLNLDLQGLVAREQILIEHVLLERRDIQEKGEFRGPSEGVASRAGRGPSSDKASSVNSVHPRNPANVSYRHAKRTDL